MRRVNKILAVLLVVLAIPTAHLLWADGPDFFEELDTFSLILGIIETPDPIPQVDWVKLTADPSCADAREAGARSDGRPAFEFDRATEGPLLTWAYDVGSDHDIAFNAWDGDAWSTKIDFLTHSSVDEVDPRIYVDSANRIYLTWWEVGAPSRMLMMKRDNRNGWGAPIEIGAGRRPSVARWDDDIVAAYERDRVGGGQEVVFAISRMGDPFEETVVSVTSLTSRLDPVVHVRGGEMWIDWKHADGVIAFSRFDHGNWKLAQGRAWTDPSWLGELTVRHLIEVEITAGH